jgi:hypothetical protein
MTYGYMALNFKKKPCCPKTHSCWEQNSKEKEVLMVENRRGSLNKGVCREIWFYLGGGGGCCCGGWVFWDMRILFSKGGRAMFAL